VKSLLLVIASLPLAAQLQVFWIQGGTAVPAGASVNLGSAALRDTVEFQFRAVNGGTVPLALQSITVNGTAFSLASPFVPLTLAAAESYDFSVRFAPAAEGSYSAGLTVNSFSTLLRATAVPGPSLFLTNGTQTTELTGPNLQVNVAAGQTLTLALAVGNPHAAPLTLNALAIRGAGFTLVDPPAPPLTLAPGETRNLPVRVGPLGEGEASGTLTLGPRQFTILAVIFRPQLAPPRIQTSETVPGNGQQLKIRLQLAQPAAGAGSGVLRAIFSGTFDDPAIVFPNGSREIQFDVAAGSREATFGGAPETVIQTGTTAGVLRLEAVTETGTTTETFRFERLPVVVDSAAARRNGSQLEVEVLGFDNTRGVGSLNFRFFDRAGAALGGVISANAADAFKEHFERGGVGGVFRLRAAFPVTGDATIVGSVLVEIANGVGRTDLQRLTFP
jgi:hypothetical protein